MLYFTKLHIKLNKLNIIRQKNFENLNEKFKDLLVKYNNKLYAKKQHFSLE